MSAHTVPENRLPSEILEGKRGLIVGSSIEPDDKVKTYNWEAGGLDNLGELRCDVGKHVIMLRILWVGGVKVKPSTGAKVPTVIFAFNPRSTGRSIREENGNPLSGCYTQETTLLGPILRGFKLV